jgi:hypothetical protein
MPGVLFSEKRGISNPVAREVNIDVTYVYTYVLFLETKHTQPYTALLIVL